MTAALTTEVSGTDAFGAAITKTLTDPAVVSGLGNLAGAAFNALTGQTGAPTAAQLAAQQAAAKAAADAQQTQLLMIGGGVAVVGIVVVIIIVVKRGRK